MRNLYRGLILALLLLLPVEVVAADALQFYHTKTNTRTSAASGVWTTYGSLTFTPTATADFFLIGFMSHESTNLAFATSRWQVDGVTQNDEGGNVGSVIPNGNAFMSTIVWKKNLDATSHTVRWQFKGVVATVWAKAASFVALEVPSGAFYAEKTTASCYVNSGVPVTKTFTATAQNYLVIYGGEELYDDEDDPQVQSPQLEMDGTDLLADLSDEHGQQDIYHWTGGSAWKYLTAGSHTARVQVVGGGSTFSDVCIKNMGLAIIPFDAFESTTTDSFTTKTTTTSTSFVDSNLSVSPTLTDGADYLVTMAYKSASTHASHAGEQEIVIDSVVYESGDQGRKDIDISTTGYMTSTAYGHTSGGGSETFKMRYRTTSAGIAAGVAQGYLLVAEIPTGAAGGSTFQFIQVSWARVPEFFTSSWATDTFFGGSAYAAFPAPS